MKKLFLLCLVIISTFFLFSSQTKAQCFNGDFETGNFSPGWTGYTSLNINGTVDLVGSIPGLVAGQHDIVTGGFDPIVGSTILPTVRTGSFALRLGDASPATSEGQTVAYTFLVTSFNVKSSFAYALVFMGGPLSHPGIPHDRPFFQWWISRTNILSQSTQINNLIDGVQPIYADDNSFTRTPNFDANQTIFKNWQTVCIEDLSDYIGTYVTLYFHTSRCTFPGIGFPPIGSEFGYAYIDALCEPNTSATPSFTCSSSYYCPQAILCDGSASVGATDHYWMVEQLDCNTGTVIPNSQRTRTFLGSPPGNL